MSELLNDHAHNIVSIISRADPKNSKQMKRMFELSALLMEPTSKSFWKKFEKFPFEEIQPEILASLLVAPLNAQIATSSSLDWTTPVVLPVTSEFASSFKQEKRPFTINPHHQLSLAPLFFLDAYLLRVIPEDRTNREHHIQMCREFQNKSLDILDKDGLYSETQVHWGPLSSDLVPMRDVALAVNSPYLVNWLDRFKWNTSAEVETTLLSLLSAFTKISECRLMNSNTDRKKDVPQLFDVFNTLMEKIQASPVHSLDLLREISLPHADQKFTVAQMLFKFLEEERNWCEIERVDRARTTSYQKVRQADLGPAVENSGKHLLQQMFTHSLLNLPLEQQRHVVKDILHTITENPNASYQHIRTHCAFLMAAVPDQLRETVKQAMLNNTALCKTQRGEKRRNGFYFFNSDPLYKNILTIQKSKSILEKELKSVSNSNKNEIWPFVLLMHMSSPSLHEGVKKIIKHIQSSPQWSNSLQVELATLFARVDMDIAPAPKRKM